MKQIRARSKDKKAKQFEKILEEGKILFLQKGTEGFKMRNLADNLKMSKNNLYNYVVSKRELWIAIRNRFYYQFREENREIIKNHNCSQERVYQVPGIPAGSDHFCLHSIIFRVIYPAALSNERLRLYQYRYTILFAFDPVYHFHCSVGIYDNTETKQRYCCC